MPVDAREPRTIIRVIGRARESSERETTISMNLDQVLKPEKAFCGCTGVKDVASGEYSRVARYSKRTEIRDASERMRDNEVRYQISALLQSKDLIPPTISSIQAAITFGLHHFAVSSTDDCGLIPACIGLYDWQRIALFADLLIFWTK